jgi:hypothetical protein
LKRVPSLRSSRRARRRKEKRKRRNNFLDIGNANRDKTFCVPVFFYRSNISWGILPCSKMDDANDVKLF